MTVLKKYPILDDTPYIDPVSYDWKREMEKAITFSKKFSSTMFTYEIQKMIGIIRYFALLEERSEIQEHDMKTRIKSLEYEIFELKLKLNEKENSQNKVKKTKKDKTILDTHKVKEDSSDRESGMVFDVYKIDNLKEKDKNHATFIEVHKVDSDD